MSLKRLDCRINTLPVNSVLKVIVKNSNYPLYRPVLSNSTPNFQTRLNFSCFPPVTSQGRSCQNRSCQDRSSQDLQTQLNMHLRMEFDSGVGPTCYFLFFYSTAFIKLGLDWFYFKLISNFYISSENLAIMLYWRIVTIQHFSFQ